MEEGGAADKAGLQMGDVITKVDDTEIQSMEDLTAVKKQYSAGDTSTFTIYRQGQTQTVQVTWDSLPAEQQSVSQNQQTTEDSSTQNGGYTNPYDLFDYFFGGGYNGSSAREAA